MYQFKGMEDTIAAISTPPGVGGIGIVRFSGKNALVIADQMFIAKNNKRPSQCKGFTVHYGYIADHRKGKEDAEVIDEVLLTVMRAPRSYTTEDMVEISCHGGRVALRSILAMALDCGARLAEPGEFTKRAFLNGRMDLTQAEAVLDIIHAKTDAFLRVSSHQLKGELTAELEFIREMLTDLYTELEAMVNFPEDDAEAHNIEKLQSQLQGVMSRIEKLLASAEQGRIMKEGIKIAICGCPNVGKSLLLNVLLRQPRAIVSDIAGTTRDTIEETAHIQGVPLQLVDTAGILKPRDSVEKEAVKRSHMTIEGADLVLFLIDASRSLSDEDDNLYQKIKSRPLLTVINKCDLEERIDETKIGEFCTDTSPLRISALMKQGIAELEEAIMTRIFHAKTIDTHGVLISNMRHIHSLKTCSSFIREAAEHFRDGLSAEFVSEDIKSAVNELDGITGRNIDTDLLDRIFSQFCIGK